MNPCVKCDSPSTVKLNRAHGPEHLCGACIPHIEPRAIEALSDVPDLTPDIERGFVQ